MLNCTPKFSLLSCLRPVRCCLLEFDLDAPDKRRCTSCERRLERLPQSVTEQLVNTAYENSRDRKHDFRLFFGACPFHRQDGCSTREITWPASLPASHTGQEIRVRAYSSRITSTSASPVDESVPAAQAVACFKQVFFFFWFAAVVLAPACWFANYARIVFSESWVYWIFRVVRYLVLFLRDTATFAMTIDCFMFIGLDLVSFARGDNIQRRSTRRTEVGVKKAFSTLPVALVVLKKS